MNLAQLLRWQAALRRTPILFGHVRFTRARALKNYATVEIHPKGEISTDAKFFRANARKLNRGNVWKAFRKR